MEGITLGRLFGIPIRVTTAFLYVSGVVVLLGFLGDPGQGRRQPGVLLLLLVSLLAHEFGHALVARRLGLRVIDVTLWHLGGMARMQELPESPRIEALVSLAGPLVNLVLAVLALPLLALTADAPLAHHLAVDFVGMNVLLGGLNLLPAFPMDGGRLLRAWLATRRSHLAATELAVRTGKWVAFAMVIAGAVAFQTMGFVLALLVALFVWFAGAKELVQVRLRHTGSPFGAGMFARGFAGPFGGAAAAGAGAREADDVVPAPRRAADEPAPSGARRPRVEAPLDERQGGGFSDDDVRRLEAFRGPLRRRAE